MPLVHLIRQTKPRCKTSEAAAKQRRSLGRKSRVLKQISFNAQHCPRRPTTYLCRRRYAFKPEAVSKCKSARDMPRILREQRKIRDYRLTSDWIYCRDIVKKGLPRGDICRCAEKQLLLKTACRAPQKREQPTVVDTE